MFRLDYRKRNAELLLDSRRRADVQQLTESSNRDTGGTISFIGHLDIILSVGCF